MTHIPATLDIFNPSSRPVLFAFPDNGTPLCREKAHALLTPNQTYTLEHIEVLSWESFVYLKEVPNQGFNSVLFAEIP